MSRRGGNRLAVLLMTGVLLGDLWDWGARWLETVLAPWEPAAQAGTLLVEQQGPLIDPNGQPTPDDGFSIDPNGQPTSDHGLSIDPNG